MRLEIERKYLLADSSWRQDCGPGHNICQGYFTQGADFLLRVRLIDAQAWLTIKGQTEGITRREFEFPIPYSEGEALLREFCAHRVVEKIRYYLPYRGFTWEIDEYLGRNHGLFTAEIELPAQDCSFPLPSWLGREISQDPRYANAALAQQPRQK